MFYYSEQPVLGSSINSGCGIPLGDRKMKSMGLAPVTLVLALVVAASAAVGVALTQWTSPSETGTATYVYPSSSFPSSISARPGETFIIQLGSNAGSTGFDWKVSTSSGIHYLNYSTVSFATLPGGSDVRNYFFKADQTGTQTITLVDQRPWAPYETAATITIQVNVG
jgi:predicted secreted protein